jgi:hypothetical protein
MSGSAKGGGNTLIGGANSTNFLYGDAKTMSQTASGGGNTLVAGYGSTSYLWGGAGVASATNQIAGNAFDFALGDYRAFIEDFRSGLDKIDLAANLGVTSFSQLHITVWSGTSTITLNAHDSLAVVGDTHLVASDFKFG